MPKPLIIALFYIIVSHALICPSWALEVNVPEHNKMALCKFERQPGSMVSVPDQRERKVIFKTRSTQGKTGKYMHANVDGADTVMSLKDVSLDRIYEGLTLGKNHDEVTRIMDAHYWGTGGMGLRVEWDLVIKKNDTTYTPAIVVCFFGGPDTGEVKKSILIGYEVWIGEEVKGK
jgi:hypothetical protein